MKFLDLTQKFFTDYELSITPKTYFGYKYIVDKVTMNMPRDADKVTRGFAQRLYNNIAMSRGLSAAKQTITVLKRIYNVGIREYGLDMTNPFNGVKMTPATPRNVIWQPHEIETFECRAKHEGFYCVGLVVYMCYELMQRPGDIVKLRMDQLDFENRTITIQQQKTHSVVVLPMSDRLWARLVNNKNLEYHYAIGPKLTMNQLNRHFNHIKSKCTIRPELQIRALRRTAVTEAAANGATEDELMAVGGWKSRQVVSVYAKPTLQAAINLQKKRGL
jgi:integrase